MDYDEHFRAAVARIRGEGRYRVFADLERQAGAFPRRRAHRPDGAPDGHGLVLERLSRHGPAPGRAGGRCTRRSTAAAPAPAAPATSPAPTTTTSLLERELADLHGKEAALLFTSGYVANEAALARSAALLPGCVILSDALNHASMIEGIRTAGCEKPIFRHNDLGHLDRKLRRADPAPPEAGRLRERLLDGRRHRADRRDLRRRRALRRDDLSRRGPRGRPVRPARRRHRRARRRDGPRSTSIEGTLAKAFGVHGRLHRGVGRAVRRRPQLSRRASSSRPRSRPRSPARALASVRHLKAATPSARAPPGARRDASSAGCWTRPACRSCRQPEPHRAGDGRRPGRVQAGIATSCSTTTASTCSRSTTRPCRAARSGCGSRRRRLHDRCRRSTA